MISSHPITPDAWHQAWDSMSWYEKLRVVLVGAYFASRRDSQPEEEPVTGEGLRRITLLRGEAQDSATTPS